MSSKSHDAENRVSNAATSVMRPMYYSFYNQVVNQLSKCATPYMLPCVVIASASGKAVEYVRSRGFGTIQEEASESQIPLAGDPKLVNPGASG